MPQRRTMAYPVARAGLPPARARCCPPCGVRAGCRPRAAARAARRALGQGIGWGLALTLAGCGAALGAGLKTAAQVAPDAVMTALAPDAADPADLSEAERAAMDGARELLSRVLRGASARQFESAIDAGRCCQLGYVPQTASLASAYVNGTIEIGPSWFELTPSEQAFVLSHEVVHVLRGHFFGQTSGEGKAWGDPLATKDVELAADLEALEILSYVDGASRCGALSYVKKRYALAREYGAVETDLASGHWSFDERHAQLLRHMSQPCDEELMTFP